MDIASLGLEVRSDQVRAANDALSRFQGEAGKAENAAQRLTMQAGGMRNAFAAATAALGVTFGGAAIATGMLNAVKRLEAIEVASRKIDKALQNNGYTADLTTKKIIAYADALERRTGRAAQDVLDLAPNLASFQFTEEVALRSIALADDMAAAWGGDLRQNFEGLGRALADPVKGFAMLSARGITLDDTQKKLVKSLMQTGQGLKAQEVVLNALEAQIKGVAEAGYTPLTRAQDNARKSIEKFFEKLVSSQGAGDALIKILNGLASAMTFLGDHIDAIVTGLEIFAAAHIVGGIVSIVGAIQTMTVGMELATVAARALSIAMAFTGGPIGLAVMALGAAYLLLRDNVSEAQKAANNANEAYRTNAQAMKVAEGASGKYSQALRDQIAMQVEVAQSAYTMAKATFDAALATRNAFRALTGLKFAPLEFNVEKADADASALGLVFEKLKDQLAKVDANLAKNKPADRNFGSGDDGKASERAARAYRDLIKSADDRIAQMKLEADVAGMTGIAADTLRFKLDLLQKGEEKGRTLAPDQIAEIEKKAAAYGKYAEAAARASLQQDLLFERQQLGRSDMDQTIANTLRGAGLPVDFSSYEAGLIRTNEQLKITRSAWEDFGRGAEDVLMGLVDGTANWRDVLKSMIPLVADLIKQLLQAQTLGGGSGGLGGLLGSLFGGLGGGFVDGAGGGLGALLGYSSGGYTGDTATNKVAGLVHGREFVTNASATARYRPILEAMNENRPLPRTVSAPATPVANQNQPQPANVNITVDVRGANGNTEIREMVNQGVKAGLAQYDKGGAYRASRDLRGANERGYMR